MGQRRGRIAIRIMSRRSIATVNPLRLFGMAQILLGHCQESPAPKACPEGLHTPVSDDKSEQGINARLRELAEEMRKLRRNLEPGRTPNRPRLESRARVNDRPAKSRKKR